MAKAKKKKTGAKKFKRNINMAEHEMRLKSIGFSERVKKLILRAVLIIIPVMLVIYWIAKTHKF
ncbi:MAG: hypothetical protein WCJ94_05755 [bacterium]